MTQKPPYGGHKGLNFPPKWRRRNLSMAHLGAKNDVIKAQVSLALPNLISVRSEEKEEKIHRGAG